MGAIFALFLLTRIMGKKQISQLTFFEYVLGITIGDLAGFISTDVEANYMHGIVALSTWFLIPFLAELLTIKSRKMRTLFEGRERVLIKDGKILEDNLKKERFSADELLEQLRTKGVFKVADVEFATLEATGTLSVLLKQENQPLTPKHMHMLMQRERQPVVVIMDGKILDEGLSASGFTREWLQSELDKLGLTLQNVFLGQVDAFGQLYVDVYNDSLEMPVPQAKALLFATLKKSQADLELFALTTRSTAASEMYSRCAREMDEVVTSLKTTLTV
jgi:uncharacterized membrane protein YcaP (DUF421 family)